MASEIAMPGVTHQDVADDIERREIAARSRPIIRRRVAIEPADSFMLRMIPGSPVRIKWRDPARARVNRYLLAAALLALAASLIYAAVQ